MTRLILSLAVLSMSLMAAPPESPKQAAPMGEACKTDKACCDKTKKECAKKECAKDAKMECAKDAKKECAKDCKDVKKS